MLPLGFKFDVDAVLVEGIGHRSDCDRLPDAMPRDAVPVPVAGIYLTKRCPRAPARCRPGFETLLGYQFHTAVATTT